MAKKEKKGPTGIEKAITAAGSQAKLATELGCTQQNISLWLSQGWVPSKRAVEIEMLHGIPRAELIDPKLLARLDTEVGL